MGWPLTCECARDETSCVCVTNRLVCTTRRIRMCVMDGIAVARRTTVVSVHGMCVVGGGTRCPRPVVCDASTSRLTCWLSHGEELSQSLCQQYLLTTYQQREQRGEARRKVYRPPTGRHSCVMRHQSPRHLGVRCGPPGVRYAGPAVPRGVRGAH